MENELIRKLAGAIEEQTKKAKSKSYDTQATVKRVEGETVWVHIPGGVDETPVSKTIACSAGDTVQVRVTNGRGFIVGNGSAPPTDDTTAIMSKEIATEARYTAETALEDAVTAHDAAISATESAATAGIAASVAQAAADAAQETANSKKTVFVTEPTPPYHVGDLWVKFDPEIFDMVDSDGNSLIDDQGNLFEAAILKEAAAYVCMVPKTAGQEFSESDFELATADNGLREWFWHDANGAHILGDVTGFRNDLTSTGMKIVDTSTENTIASFGTETSIRTTNGTELAHIGYAPGASQGGGTDTAPYYTFGIRDEDEPAPGNYSFAGGADVVASGYSSHAEGTGTGATKTAAHAEGLYNVSWADGAHSEGRSTQATGNYSHSEGYYSRAIGDNSHAQNLGTRAASDNQTTLGTYNEEDDQDTYAVIIGNGTTENSRSNALTVDWNGVIDTANGTVPVFPLFDVVSVNKTFTVSANSTQNQSFAPAAADVPSGYTRVGLCGWNTANGNVFIVTCTGTTITFGNKSSSNITCTNAQVDWLYIRSSI